RDAVAIAGATSTTYTVVAADVGHAITFEVTPVAGTGASPGTAVASSGVTILNPRSSVARGKFTGMASVGQLLTGEYTYGAVVGNAQGTSTFPMLRDAVAITGATSRTYTVVAADMGHSIAFEVTPVAATVASPGAPATSLGVTIL